MTGLTLCLDPAMRMQRMGATRRQIVECLDSVRTDCAKPAECPHREVGCREVNARYLRQLVALKAARA